MSNEFFDPEYIAVLCDALSLFLDRNPEFSVRPFSVCYGYYEKDTDTCISFGFIHGVLEDNALLFSGEKLNGLHLRLSIQSYDGKICSSSFLNNPHEEVSRVSKRLFLFPRSSRFPETSKQTVEILFRVFKDPWRYPQTFDVY